MPETIPQSSSHHHFYRCYRLFPNMRFMIVFTLQSHPMLEIFQRPRLAIRKNAEHFNMPWSNHNHNGVPSGKRLHNYGKSPCFQWENSLFLWPCSIANCWHNQRVLLVIWLKRRFLIPIRHGLCKSKGMEELCHLHINISKWGGHVYRCLQYHG